MLEEFIRRYPGKQYLSTSFGIVRANLKEFSRDLNSILVRLNVATTNITPYIPSVADFNKTAREYLGRNPGGTAAQASSILNYRDLALAETFYTTAFTIKEEFNSMFVK